MQLRAFAACAAVCCTLLTTQPCLTAAAEPPSAEAQATLRRGYQAVSTGLLPTADSLLTQSINEWQRTGQPPDELSALFKSRSGVRKQQGKLDAALADLDEAVRLLTQGGDARADPAEVQRTFVLRARVNAQTRRWKEAEADFSGAIARLDELDAIESTNPFLYSERAAVRSRLGQYGGAADDALAASVEFRDIGDRLRGLLASADAALALYGAGEVDEAVKTMRTTFNAFGTRSPSSNNPDDIGVLQSLARKQAELHLAYAAHLVGTNGQLAEAQKQWERGCVLLEGYVVDAVQRQDDELALQRADAERAEARGREDAPLRAPSVAGNIFNTAPLAKLNGMDPESPFVTQRPQSGYFFYKTGEGSVERRDSGTALASVDPRLSCASFRKAAWLRDNRPEWPPALVENAERYAAAVPQGPVVLPPKGSALDKSACSVLLGRPGVGDAVPCF